MPDQIRGMIASCAWDARKFELGKSEVTLLLDAGLPKTETFPA